MTDPALTPMTLFVCRGNMFRSPMAKAFYNLYADDGSVAESCGTWVLLEKNTGKTLQEIGGLGTSIEYLRVRGINISQERAQPITPGLVEKAERIVVMAEKDTWPEYLKTSPKVLVWEVDNPDILNSADTERIGLQIERLVRELLN